MSVAYPKIEFSNGGAQAQQARAQIGQSLNFLGPEKLTLILSIPNLEEYLDPGSLLKNNSPTRK